MIQGKPPEIILTMIVKNEAHNIADTIHSVRDLVDAAVIVDTGSTDGTSSVAVRANLAPLSNNAPEIPLFIYERPFVDFSTTRNVAIELGMQHYPNAFQIMLSGTETVKNGAMMRRHIQNLVQLNPQFTCFNVRMKCGELVFPSPRVFLPSAGWRYKGRYHELLQGGTGIHYHQEPLGTVNYAGGEDKTESWKHGLELLKKDHEEDPTNGRYVFYIAEVLRCLGRNQEAKFWYAKRCELDGYIEEKAMSCLYTGRMSEDDKVSWFLRSYDYAPHRAEALYELAWHWHMQPKEYWARSLLFAKAAYEKVLPAGLFIETPIYTWKAADLVAAKAWHFNEWKIGYDAALNARDNGPTTAHDAETAIRLHNNVKFYESRKRAGVF